MLTKYVLGRVVKFNIFVCTYCKTVDLLKILSVLSMITILYTDNVFNLLICLRQYLRHFTHFDIDIANGILFNCSENIFKNDIVK